MRFLAVALAAVALVSCSRDKDVAKRRYLENGNKYFDRGKFKEARIMYRNALQKDPRYGQAYYRLGLTELRLGQVPGSVGSFRRAVELLPPGSPDRDDAQVKLAELYLAFAQEKQLREEAETIAKGLLQKDPNSYDGHRLMGEAHFLRARDALATTVRREEGQQSLRAAIAEFRKANFIKPNQTPLMIALARVLKWDEQVAEAEQLYRALIAREKGLMLGYSELYALLIGQKREAEAENILKTAIQNNPKDFNYLVMLASHYFATNRRGEMVRAIDDLKAHAKEWPQAYITAGDFYFRVGDADEAIRQYKQGMAADTKRKAAYQKRMIEVLMRQGKKTAAAEINDAILKDDPKDPDARSLQAAFMLEQGNIQQAVTQLQSVITADPKNFIARLNLGRAHAARNELELARQQLNEAIQIRPDYVPAHIALAQLQIRRGEFEPAIKSAANILALDKGNVQAQLIHAAALMGLRRFEESRQILQRMLASEANAPDVLVQMALTYLAEGKVKDAEATFRKVYQLNPSDLRGMLGVSETYMAENKADLALQLLQSELQKNPKRADVRMALGNLAVRAGRFDLGIGEFQNVLAGLDKGSKASGDVYLRIGETYRRKGDFARAIENLQKAREVVPDNSMVVSTLALVLDAGNRREEAKKAYEQALKLDPRNGVALNNLAYLIAETGGDLDQALTYVQRAKQILPNIHEVSDTMGWIYLKKNLSDNAIEIFRDLVAKEPKHSTYRYHLGMALSQKGDKLRALQELQSALRNNPPKAEEVKIRELIQKLG